MNFFTFLLISKRPKPLALMFAALLSQTACSTSYDVVPVSELSKLDNPEGVYFQLPKTEVTVEIVLSRTTLTYGRDSGANVALAKLSLDTDPVCSLLDLQFPGEDCAKKVTLHDVYQQNLKACPSLLSEEDDTFSAKDVIVLAANSFKRNGKVKASDFSFYTKAVADEKHLYRMNVMTDWWASYTHTVNLNERGIITSGSSLIKDGLSPALAATLKGLVSVLSPISAATGGSTDRAKYKKSVDTRQQVFCQQFLQSVELQEEISTLQREQIEYLKDLTDNIPVDVVKLALAEFKKSIERIHASNPRASERIKISKKDQSVIATETIVPKEFEAIQLFEPKDLSWQFYPVRLEPKKDDSTQKRLPLATGKLAQHFGYLKAGDDIKAKVDAYSIDLSSGIKYKVETTQQRPAKQKGNSKTGSQNPPLNPVQPPNPSPKKPSSPHGYPYRVPTAVKIVLKEQNDDQRVVVAEGDIQVAQVSPIAYLPRKFDGSQGSVDITYFADSGSASMIKIGATPVSSDVISSVFGTINDYRSAVATEEAADAARAEAAAQAALTAEADAIKRETDYLAAVLANLEAQQALLDYQSSDGALDDDFEEDSEE